MSRRTSLPGAAELFRATSPAAEPEPDRVHHPGVGAVAPLPEPAETTPRRIAPVGAPADPVDPARRSSVRNTRRIRSVGEHAPSGRERHEEKITVYCSAEELIDLEQARLTLRGDFGMAVDRGRIVREAIAVVIADLEAKGEASILLRRLRGA